MNIIPDDSRVLWRALLDRMEMKWSSVGTSTFLLAWLTAQSMGLWKEHPVMLSAVAEWWSGQITQLWASFRCQCFKCHVNYCDLQLPVSYTQSRAEVSTQVGFWNPMESVDSSHNPHWSSWWAAAFVKDRCWRSLWRPVFHGRDPTMGQWKSVRSPAPEEEAVAGTMCDEMTTDSISQIPAPLAGWKYRKLGVKLSLGRRETWEERCF